MREGNTDEENNGYVVFQMKYPRISLETRPVFVDLLRRPGIDSQPGEIDSSESITGLHKRLQIRAQGGGPLCPAPPLSTAGFWTDF